MLTSTLARTIIVPDMRKMAFILAVTLGCLISIEVRTAPKPITLALEQRTTLHVGELAVLRIPSDSRYSHFQGNTGPRLALVRRLPHSILYRAVRVGPEVIVISPDGANLECISCATLHYFIQIVARK
jgi:hypothetical protein